MVLNPCHKDVEGCMLRSLEVDRYETSGGDVSAEAQIEAQRGECEEIDIARDSAIGALDL